MARTPTSERVLLISHNHCNLSIDDVLPTRYSQRVPRRNARVACAPATGRTCVNAVAQKWADTTNWYPKVMRKDYAVGMNITESEVDDPDVLYYEKLRVRCSAQLYRLLQSTGR